MTRHQAEARKPRLIFLTQWFDPEPALKGAAFARRLSELGFDVEVVTGFPNYPGGKVYDRYRVRPIQRQDFGDFRLTRLALYPSHDSSKLGRILNYASFFISATLYLTFGMRRCDVIYAYHPPLTTAVAAAAARIIKRTPVVLDIQDMWPDTLRATGMITSEGVLRIVGLVCRWTWRGVDRISVISEGFRRLLIARDVPDFKISVVPNWADETVARASTGTTPEAFNVPGKFRVLFAGNMGAAQALDSVLDAAAIVAEERPEIEFWLLGSGIELDHLKLRVEREKLGNVRFLPRVPMADVGAYLSAAECLLVHLRADPLFTVTIPSKTQAYMAAGKPIIMAVEGDAAELIRRAGGGIVVPPQDPQRLAEAACNLAGLPPEELARLGANARRFYNEQLSFDRGTRTLAKLLHSVLKQAQPAEISQ
ncbi:glycosyltransferase family 4 protein [Chelativorans sp.]|uniref:glycosyltransferase family 4 protein n=1 Tax=Chelativorans sp. TaxID=2203393 RepID=UPI0028118732|nr:glycosyltransferase family 4 protein [Chelativorans sp.]